MSASCSSTYDRSARGPDPGARRPRRHRGFLVALLASIAAFALPVSPAFGEGSVDINSGPGGNLRHALQGAPGFGGAGLINGFTVLQVYARAGETIQLGSSATGVGAGNILVLPEGTDLAGKVYPTDPVYATAVRNCDVDAPGTGVISTRAQEVAGPEASPDGDPDTWTPCTYVAPADGFYPVIMASPGTVNDATTGTVDAPLQPADSFQISIWDVTVRDTSGAVQPGRLFADEFLLYVGAEPSGGVEVVPYTKTGYEFQVNFAEHLGGGWVLRSDDLGIVNATTGERLDASFACKPNEDTANTCPDTSAGFGPPEARHPLFVNRPDAVVKAALAAERGFAPAPIAPSSNPLGATFTGSDGQAEATKRGAGATINVTSPVQLAGLESTLEIDINRNNIWGDAPDYVDTQELQADGTNAYAWNGRDAAGDVPPCGDYPYRVRSTLAEVHFPMFDVEGSGGTQIQRLSLPSDPLLGNVYAASYNDIDPIKNYDTLPSNSPNTVTGGDSSVAGFHAWAFPEGNTDYIDTWAKLPEVDDRGILRLLCADPQVVKTAEPSPIVPGEDATFKLVVRNNGPDAATDVRVVDDLPDTVQFKDASTGCVEAASVVTCSLASLAPNATHTFEITVAVPSSLKDCVENSATVTNTTFDTNLANNTSADCFPINRESDLSIDKQASSATVAAGGQVMYTLVVRNHGPSDDPNAKVSDPLAAGLSLASAQASQGTCTTTNNTLNCELGTLRAGGSAQVQMTVNVTATSGCIPNTARVRGANTDPTPENNQDSAQICVTGGDPIFDLEVRKTVNDKTPVVGQTVRYRVVVRNNGPAAAPDVKIADTLNAPVTVVSVRSTQGSCQRRIPMPCELGTIEAGESVTITIRVKHRQATGCSPRQRNAASATGAGTDTNPANNMDTVDVCVRKVKLKLTKVASRERVRGGETFSYQIRVRNPTKGEARNVKVCDRLPFGLRYVSSKPKAKVSGRRQCWTIRSLKAGQSRTFRITVRAASGASGRKRNTVTATSPTTSPAHDDDTVDITPRPDNPTG